MEIFENLSQYIQYLIMIVGCIEFVKGIVKEKRFGIYRFIQIIICIIAGISFVLQQELIVEIFKFIFDSLFSFLLFLSLSTLCYDLIIRKVNDERKKANII